MARLRANFLKVRRRPKGEEATADFYRRALNSPDAVIFVAVVNGKLAGYVYAEVEKRQDDLISIPRVSINELAVHRDYRKAGTGKKLMQIVEAWARSKGINVLHLDVWEVNSDAIAFYEKLGYQPILRKMEKRLK